MNGTWFIALGGYARAGKDAVADFLVEQGSWHKHYFSEPLEKALLALNPDIVVTFEDEEKGISFQQARPYQQIHSVMGYEKSKEIPAVRGLLQRLGTEVGRKMFGENIWCDIAKGAVMRERHAGFNVALTGCRFSNELEMVQQQEKSLSIWVARPGISPINSHASDNSLAPGDFDLVLNNDSTLTALRNTVTQLADHLALQPIDDGNLASTLSNLIAQLVQP